MGAFASQPMGCEGPLKTMANLANVFSGYLLIMYPVILVSLRPVNAAPTMNLGAIWFNKLHQQQRTNQQQMTPENWEDLMVEWQDSMHRNGMDNYPRFQVGSTSPLSFVCFI